ncbi:GGDEF domain-containing protein [Psychromonas hadalis]|uniref:GGDEF domain-containing protein n=1 Tax=Psychromonas hadalis TaxID=211669 RepID=UPI0003B696F4|nr:GGDEF domain-containing protein [Psychromonas hadalis]
MDSFQWDDTFITGQKEVDDQHFYLVKLINQFGELITENEVSFKRVNTVYEELKSYAIYHFQQEEQLMRDAGIDAKFLTLHINVHQDFLGKVVMMHEQLSESNFSASKHLLDFLTHWLVFHILGMDKNMGRQIDKINAGMPALQAFQSEVAEKDGTTEALLGALNSLFSQVSARNQELVLLNQSLENKVAERTRALLQLNKNLEHLAITDQLTNLPNRRFAISHLSMLWDKPNNSTLSLSCLMIDIDNFKIVNDNYGHDAGDKVLIELTYKLQQTLRNDDVICRLGGDEFLVICENTALSGAHHIAKILSEAVQTLTVSVGSGVWLGSISIGVATRLSSMKNLEELIKMADQGVYLAKKSGKGCVKSI